MDKRTSKRFHVISVGVEEEAATMRSEPTANGQSAASSSIEMETQFSSASRHEYWIHQLIKWSFYCRIDDHPPSTSYQIRNSKISSQLRRTPQFNLFLGDFHSSRLNGLSLLFLRRARGTELIWTVAINPTAVD